MTFAHMAGVQRLFRTWQSPRMFARYSRSLWVAFGLLWVAEGLISGGNMPIAMPVTAGTGLPMPPLPPRHVSRPRLTSALNAAQHMPLVLISAGPGAGKTVLLSEWARGAGLPVAWFAARPDDNHPRRFWGKLRSAVQASGVLDTNDVDRAPGDAAFESFAVFFQDVLWPATPMMLIIDDAHVLTHPDILDGLDNIVRSAHPQVHLVIAARSDPMLPLHRYRLAGQMRELRVTDLAMTDSEARALLAAHGVILSPAAFDALVARTEGWIAGIRLSAMRMEGTERPADFVAEFAVDQGSIGEYLTFEVLDRLPERMRRTLVSTGFLDVVTGELADAVTAQAGCADTLAELARTNSFVIPLEAAHIRYRYHPLLAEILRYNLQNLGPDVRQVLFRRASTWFEEQNDLRSAFHWAVSCRDVERAVSLLARGVVAEAFVRGDGPGRSDLLGVLPLDVPAGADEMRAPEISIARSAVVVLTADTESAAHELERVEQDVLTVELANPDLQVSALLNLLILGQKAGDAHVVEVAASRVLAVDDADLNAPARGLRARARIALAEAELWDGRDDDVEPQLREALALAEQDGLDSVALDALGMLALANVYSSRMVSAEEAAQRARELLLSSPNLAPPITLELATAQRSLLAADFQAMAGAIGRAVAGAAIESDPALAALAAQARAQLLLATDQAGAAKTALEAAPGVRGGTAMIRARHDMLLASIDTALGRARRALRLLDRYRESSFAAQAAVVAAKAHLALGDLRTAEDCARKVVAEPGMQVDRGALIDALLCTANIAQLRGDPGRAVEILSQAIEIADGDLTLPFVQLDGEFATLLTSHAQLAAQWPARPRGARNELTIESGRKKIPRLPEPLTARERAVLQFLATTMSTAEIAHELFLSVNTVKTHLGSIYRKLAAAKRREAVQRARELELI